MKYNVRNATLPDLEGILPTQKEKRGMMEDGLRSCTKFLLLYTTKWELLKYITAVLEGKRSEYTKRSREGEGWRDGWLQSQKSLLDLIIVTYIRTHQQKKAPRRKKKSSALEIMKLWRNSGEFVKKSCSHIWHLIPFALSPSVSHFSLCKSLRVTARGRKTEWARIIKFFPFFLVSCIRFSSFFTESEV